MPDLVQGIFLVFTAQGELLRQNDEKIISLFKPYGFDESTVSTTRSFITHNYFMKNFLKYHSLYDVDIF